MRGPVQCVVSTSQRFAADICAWRSFLVNAVCDYPADLPLCAEIQRGTHTLSRPSPSRATPHAGTRVCSCGRAEPPLISWRSPGCTGLCDGLVGRLGARFQSFIQLTLEQAGGGGASSFLPTQVRLCTYRRGWSRLYCISSSFFLFRNKTSTCLPPALHHFAVMVS